MSKGRIIEMPSSCMCQSCAIRHTEDCGRYPDFALPDDECYIEEYSVDCDNCDLGCPTFYCALYERKK